MVLNYTSVKLFKKIKWPHLNLGILNLLSMDHSENEIETPFSPLPDTLSVSKFLL